MSENGDCFLIFLAFSCYILAPIQMKETLDGSVLLNLGRFKWCRLQLPEFTSWLKKHWWLIRIMTHSYKNVQELEPAAFSKPVEIRLYFLENPLLKKKLRQEKNHPHSY